MRHSILFYVVVFGFGACHTASNDAENVVHGVERLAIYYPLDSLGTNGEKLYHTIPEVELTSQNNLSFKTASLKGKIVLTDFFFTSCNGTCPRMTNQLARVQNAFAQNEKFKIVSYTVDPVRDSSASLNNYAKQFNADESQWTFVTGSKKILYDLARYGYFLPVEPGSGDSEDFIHSDQFILVDYNSHIRGYYNGTDSTAVDSLISDIKTLLKQN
jgi:protein SCO1